MAQQKPAYILYNSKGKKVSYEKMINHLVENDVVENEPECVLILMN
jgi:uncharacterized iron-regulated protein